MIHNNYILLVVLLGIFHSCTTPPNKSEQKKLQKQVFKNAIKYGDASVAKSALYNIIALDPADSSYIDSLFVFYFNTGSYPQTILLGRELIERNPEDTTVLELLAVSRQSVGLYKESLEDYERLLKMTMRPNYLYQMATIQFSLSRIEECSQSINTLLSIQGLENTNVMITYGKNQRQQVPIVAAAHNIKGVLAKELNQMEVAISSFQQALEIFPDFVLAKGNLQALQQGDSPKASN